ncbi:hypothetical protein BN2476_940040 [Paraburkholderia piptadeniae]|uniref:Uncharacterized protein n=1 Tax=Paraburkholderia piptadeniae TaxID=1701573 RepID=A0A1N7STS2_9BURK|nr:hypothetical protein BN2476_940040 [Paraburkholderia piptadeniae]
MSPLGTRLVCAVDRTLAHYTHSSPVSPLGTPSHSSEIRRQTSHLFNRSARVRQPRQQTGLEHGFSMVHPQTASADWWR